MKCPHCGGAVQLVPVKEADEPPTHATLTKHSLDDDLADDAEKLHVTMGEGVVIYTLKEWEPDKTVWRRIDTIIKQHGGKWISAGKDSHWEVPT